MSEQADAVNAIRADFAQIAEKHCNIEAMLLATVDRLAAHLAAIAQLDSEEGQRQLEWAVTTLREMTADRVELMRCGDEGAAVN